MNNETRFLGYNGNLCEFVVMDVIGGTDSNIVIDTGQGNHDIEFNIWDLWRAVRRYRRGVRQERRESRRYTRQNNRETTRENP